MNERILQIKPDPRCVEVLTQIGVDLGRRWPSDEPACVDELVDAGIEQLV